MAPIPQETLFVKGQAKPMTRPRPLEGEEVVISGMSGIFPSSNSVSEFMDNLYNKVDMVTPDNPRWIFNHPEVPQHLGKVNGMDKFDAQFFRVHYKQAATMEPMSRKLLEHAYSAIFDSGINPLQLRGKKVGVFIGSTFSESEKIVIYENIQRNGFGITGCNKSMYANRISYWIDGKGPSYALDLACASSMVCLEHAYRSITDGQCDAAIVGGCNLCMHPNISLNLRRTGVLCLDGKTKCFDKHGDGYVRSDAISVVFLQKAKDAKRIYSQVYHAQGNYSLRRDAEFLPIRKSEDIEDFLNEFYSSIDVSPSDVEFLEAHGTAIAEADRNELEAVGKIFGKVKPIKVGSVKSNMGHSEPASGVCAITKACLAYHKGELPANLHYNEPQDDISSVRDGKVDILTENVAFNRGYIALNSFSYTGANIHVLLKGLYKPKNLEKYQTTIPRLVLISGRQESSVKTILDKLKSQPLDPEQIGLLHNIHQSDIPGHMCRGFTVLDTNEKKETVSLAENLDYYSGTKRPLWFVYSGMGSQWATMGAELMRIPIFAGAIQRCDKVLRPKGIDILKILTEPDKKIYDNILHSFVGIAAVQIGLTDILNALEIIPDNIIGHSVGELGCAYADGCFTAEEMIIAAYSRGLVSIQTPFIKGSMAAVGLGYKNVIDLCPSEIEVACHNSSESSTISGPEEIMKKFVAELTERGIFAKEVPCSNIAYHSKYIAGAGPALLKYLSEVIRKPKQRSEKWVSTSVPEDKWDLPMAKYSSAEYHTNNLLNSVLFEETAQRIPSNAIIIEIAPHGLLQAILKRSHSECSNIPMTRRQHSNPVQFFLESIGKMYQEGLNPKIENLYPKIEFPVSTETPLLSSFVEWVHTEDWPQAKYNTKEKRTPMIRSFVISIHDDDYKFLEEYTREGKYIFPEAAQLVLVWETLAMLKEVNFQDMSVVFKDVQFYDDAVISKEFPLKFGIMVRRGDNRFEISNDGIPIASGYIMEVKECGQAFRSLDKEKVEGDDIILNADEVYRIMQLKGFNYKDEFRSIVSSNASRTEANIKFSHEWATFLDSLIQLNTFYKDHEGISKPKTIQKLSISVGLHNKAIEMAQAIGKDTLQADSYSVYGLTRCGGVEIENIMFEEKSKKDVLPDIIETASFIPHFTTGNVNMNTALLINLQVIVDNIFEKSIKMTEIVTDSSPLITDSINQVKDKLPTVNFDLNVVMPSSTFDFKELQIISKSNVFIVRNLLSDVQKMNNIYNVLSNNVFVLALEDITTTVQPQYELFNIVTAMTVSNKILILLNKAKPATIDAVTYLPIDHEVDFKWISRVQSELLKSNRLVLVSESRPACGLISFFKQLRKNNPYKIWLVLIDGADSHSFNPQNNVFKEQLQKNLSINILKNGKWGGYYYLPTEKTAIIQNIQLTSALPGDIDNLNWSEVPSVPSSNTTVHICYTGPSFRDAQKAVGVIKNNTNSFGMDFSGITNNGEKVMGLVSSGALTTVVESDIDLLWPIPKHWSFEDAATIPLPYVHAYYCLATFHPLPRGRSVFVSGGAGAFGQAVISLCLALDSTVYTVVSNQKKKQFLMKLFPQLKENNIGCSSNDTFYTMVVENSKGECCDIVINCYSGNLREAAMKCVGRFGIFIDVSDFDSNHNKDFGMSFLQMERNYRVVNIEQLFKPENEKQIKQLQYMIAEGIERGIVRPLTRVVYQPADVSKAFRFLSTSKHRGRVLFSVTTSQGLNVKPTITYSSEESYVAVIDENELGLELVDRWVRKGVRKVVIHLKKFSGYFRSKLLFWKKQGVILNLSSENLQTEDGCVNILKEAKALGPVRGIFIFLDSKIKSEIFEQSAFSENYKQNALVVANLDSVSRKLCNELRHFVVLPRNSDYTVEKYSVSISEQICQSRKERNLPALVYHVPTIIELDDKSKYHQSKALPQTISAMFNALETSLKLKHTNVVSFNLEKQCKANYLEKISKILGIKAFENLSDNLTLSDLGLNEVNLEEIRSILKDTLALNYTSEKFCSLTLGRLKVLNVLAKQNINFDSGLGAFYTFIDKDECMATEPMVAMPTKISNASEKEEELDPNATYLMLIPGFEGHHQIFTAICERVKVAAMTLQLGPDVADISIQQIAANIKKFMKKRFEMKSKFYFLGYSFGVNVALELAALMEKEGHVGIVYCLDSSPDTVRIQLDAYVGQLNEDQLQNSIVEHMYQLMTGGRNEKLTAELKTLDQWNDKVEACLKKLGGLVNYSNQYKRSIMKTAYERIKLAKDYKADLKLESEIVLMKGIPHPNAKDLADDYNLSKYTNKPVKIFNLKSDHALAPYDCRVSNIVNSFLEPSLLRDFKQKNLCESYQFDPFKTW